MDNAALSMESRPSSSTGPSARATAPAELSTPVSSLTRGLPRTCLLVTTVSDYRWRDLTTIRDDTNYSSLRLPGPCHRGLQLPGQGSGHHYLARLRKSCSGLSLSASRRKGIWRSRLWVMDGILVSPVYSLKAIHLFEVLDMLCPPTYSQCVLIL